MHFFNIPFISQPLQEKVGTFFFPFGLLLQEELVLLGWRHYLLLQSSLLSCHIHALSQLLTETALPLLLLTGLLQVVKECTRIPIFVMIRPRGGDFLYSDRETEVMKADIQLAKQYGADGLVFGALTEDGYVDTELCTALLG